jgi:hypothetical protein
MEILMTKSSAFLEYMKLHLLSLEQDATMLQDKMDSFKGDLDSDEYRDLEMEDVLNTGEMRATNHLLSVATDIMNSTNERYE